MWSVPGQLGNTVGAASLDLAEGTYQVQIAANVAFDGLKGGALLGLALATRYFFQDGEDLEMGHSNWLHWAVTWVCPSNSSSGYARLGCCSI